MNRTFNIFFYLFFIIIPVFSQSDEIWFNDFGGDENYLLPQQVEQYILKMKRENEETIVGGYVSSIYHESVDSARIILLINESYVDSVYSNNGLFSFSVKDLSSRIALKISHPDFYDLDTAMILTASDYNILQLVMNPKYKVSIRGRVFAGNIPLEGVSVRIRHLENVININTRGCYYDKEDYWNCLYQGMFRYNLITVNPDDSIYLTLTKEGMKPFYRGMVVKEYTGEVMHMKMKYAEMLPIIPKYNLGLKISFPVMSVSNDWFVGISAYRNLGKGFWRRINLGVEADAYITTITVSHPTFINLPQSSSDSTYIHPFTGPSLLLWIVPPEKRYFSTYTGSTVAYNFSKSGVIFQPFAGTRVFLDLNKAINLELRYTGYQADVIHYVFNGYGDSSRHKEQEFFRKLSLNLGIQIVL